MLNPFHRTLVTNLSMDQCVGAIGGIIQRRPSAIGLPPPFVAWSVIVGQVNERGFWLRTRTVAGSAVMLVGRWRTSAGATELSIWLLPEFMWLVAIVLLGGTATVLARGWFQVIIGIVAAGFIVLFAISWAVESRRLWRGVSAALLGKVGEPRVDGL